MKETTEAKEILKEKQRKKDLNNKTINKVVVPEVMPGVESTDFVVQPENVHVDEAGDASTSACLDKQLQQNEQSETTKAPLSSTDKDLGTVPRAYTEATKRGVNGRRSAFQAPIDFLFNPLNPLPTNEQIQAESFEYKIRSARSWQSHSFKLLPGTYYLLADVETENIDVIR